MHRLGSGGRCQAFNKKADHIHASQDWQSLYIRIGALGNIWRLLLECPAMKSVREVCAFAY